MSVSFKEFNTFVGMIADAKFPIMIRGQHGVGKSQLVYQFAQRVNLPVVERRASQMTEGDLVGLPVIDGDSTSWNPPDWYKKACNEPVVLFMDEIDRATTEVRQGFFQLADSRALNGHTLHPDTILFAAVNGGKHGSKYQVNDMDPAELDRWTVFDVEPTVEDWLGYAAQDNRVNPIIVDFIRHNHSHLENKRDFEPGKVYPSRRSWERLSQTVDRADLLGEGYKSRLATLFNIATGFVGFEAAVALKDHAEKYENMVTVDDILTGKGLPIVKKWKLTEHVAMVEKMMQDGALDVNMAPERIENLGRYFMMLPSEAAMKFYSSMTSNKSYIPFILKLHGLTIDGKSLKTHMTSMLQKK